MWKLTAASCIGLRGATVLVGFFVLLNCSGVESSVVRSLGYRLPNGATVGNVGDLVGTLTTSDAESLSPRQDGTVLETQPFSGENSKPSYCSMT